MNDLGRLGLRWLRLGFPLWTGDEPPRRHVPPPLRVACPHCTNIDTMTRHCTNPACGWVGCTCGALVYSRRRHRHPRHGSGRDTCHDPAAAV